MIFFALGGHTMLRYASRNSLLRRRVGWNMWLLVALNSGRGPWAALAPANATLSLVHVHNPHVLHADQWLRHAVVGHEIPRNLSALPSAGTYGNPTEVVKSGGFNQGWCNPLGWRLKARLGAYGRPTASVSLVT